MGDPLMGFGPPSRSISTAPPRVSRPRAPLLGFLRPFNARRRRESTSRTSCPARAPWWCQGVRQQLPRCQLRCRSQVFPTSQRPSSSLRRPAIFRRVAFVGFRPSGNFLPRILDDSSSPTCPLDVPPIELALIPVLGGDARGHSSQCLGHSGRNLSSPTGLSSSWKSICVIEA